MPAAKNPILRIEDTEGNVYCDQKDGKDYQKRFTELREKIRKASQQNRLLIREGLPDQAFKCEKDRHRFLDHCARAVFEYMKDKDPTELKNLLEEARRENSSQLEKTRRILQSSGYSQKAVDEVMKILKRDLDEILENSRRNSVDVNLKWGFHPQSHPWKKRTRDLIQTIRDIYIKYSPLGPNDYQIAQNMSLVFKSLGISPSPADTLRRYFHQP